MEGKEESKETASVPTRPSQIPILKDVTRFSLANVKEAKAFFEEEGYCVIGAAASPKECASLDAQLLKDVKAMCPTHLKPKDSWSNISWKHLTANDQKNIRRSDGIAQCDAAWEARLLPQIQDKFASFFEVEREELVASMDCVFVGVRPATDDGKMKLWLHADQVRQMFCCGDLSHRLANDWPQAPASSGVYGADFLSIQGYLSLVDATDRKSGQTVVVPRSHRSPESERLAESLETAFGRSRALATFKKHWVLFPPLMQQQLASRAVAVPLLQGDLLLWNSRVAHMGRPGYRRGFALAYNLRSLSEYQARLHRLVAYIRGNGTTHWPITKRTFPLHERGFSKRATGSAPIKPYTPMLLKPDALPRYIIDSESVEAAVEILISSFQGNQQAVKEFLLQFIPPLRASLI